MSAKNLKLKSHLCALLGFSELELQAVDTVDEPNSSQVSAEVSKQVGELKVLDIEVPFLAVCLGAMWNHVYRSAPSAS